MKPSIDEATGPDTTAITRRAHLVEPEQPGWTIDASFDLVRGHLLSPQDLLYTLDALYGPHGYTVGRSCLVLPTGGNTARYDITLQYNGPHTSGMLVGGAVEGLTRGKNAAAWDVQTSRVTVRDADGTVLYDRRDTTHQRDE